MDPATRATRFTESPSGELPASGVVSARGGLPGGLRGFLDALPVALVVLDEDLHVQLCNAAFLRHFTALEVGADIESFLPRGELEAARRRARVGTPAKLSARLATRSGTTEVDLELSTVAGHSREYFCLAFEPRRAAGPDTEARELPALEQRQPRLAALQRQAVISNLAGAVAHELNNMLSVIMASAELAGRASQRALDPSRDLERVEEASERAAEVLGDLLRFMGKRGAAAEDIDPSQAVRALDRLIECGVRRGIQLSLRLEAVREVHVVRPHFEAALLGLIDNAREALLGTGSIALIVEERRVHDLEATSLGVKPGCYASIRVEDSGPGMVPELLARAGEPYFTTKPSPTGAGLGITAARTFAQGAGGTLTLTSAPGRGTTAELLLPVLVR